MRGQRLGCRLGGAARRPVPGSPSHATVLFIPNSRFVHTVSSAWPSSSTILSTSNSPVRSIFFGWRSASFRRNWHSSTSALRASVAGSDHATERSQKVHEEEEEEEDDSTRRKARDGREEEDDEEIPASAKRRRKDRQEVVIDSSDPEEIEKAQEEEQLRRLQQLRLDRAEGRDEEDDDALAEEEDYERKETSKERKARLKEEKKERERARKKCLAYCTADAYVLHKLYRALRADEVIASEWKISYIRRDRKYIRLQCFDGSEVYVFPFGSFVCWDIDDADFIRIRQIIRQTERGERTEIYDDFDFVYGRDTAVDPEDDELIIKKDDPMAKWPVSFALAQSIKLDYFEQEVKVTFQEMQALSHYLARNGSIPLGPTKIVQEMGKIMELLVNVNLGETDFVSDIPDEFWEDAESANTWKIFNSHLGVKNRAKVLDSQLKMFNDFYSMLSSEVHVKKSTRLEWAIIFLISIEVVFGVADHSEWLASLIP